MFNVLFNFYGCIYCILLEEKIYNYKVYDLKIVS